MSVNQQSLISGHSKEFVEICKPKNMFFLQEADAEIEAMLAQLKS